MHNVSDEVEVNQEVRVRVINVDMDRGKFAGESHSTATRLATPPCVCISGRLTPLATRALANTATIGRSEFIVHCDCWQWPLLVSCPLLASLSIA